MKMSRSLHITLTKKQKDYGFVAVMLLIPTIHFIIFWGIVNFNSIALAFQRLDITTGEYYFTWDNFGDLLAYFKTGTLRVALENTLYTAAFQIIFLFPWGFFLTYFLYKKIPLTGAWRLFLFLPTILPAVFLTSITKYAIQTVGPIGKIWSILFNKDIPTLGMDELYSRVFLIAYFFLTNFGGQFLLFTGAMTRIPNQILEAAKLDGAGMRVEFFKIVFPLCWPTFSMLLILNITSVFTSAGSILLLTGGRANTQTIAYWIFMQVNDKTSPSLFIPSALGIVLTLILFPIISLSRWGLSKIWNDVEF